MRFEAEARYTANVPDKQFWLQEPGYNLMKSLDSGGVPREGATVRFAWSEAGLYVHADLYDSFVVASNPHDEQLHYKTGDVFELFLKPLNEDYYWEMYATPFGNKSTLFFPRERDGMLVENFLRDHEFRGLRVDSEIKGEGWSADMFVPAAQMTALGAAWDAGAEWTVLCGRYNYNNNELTEPELSMWPPVSITNYHLTEEYARLDFKNRG